MSGPRLDLAPAPRPGNRVVNVALTDNSLTTLVTVGVDEKAVLVGLWYSNPTDTDSVAHIQVEGASDPFFQVNVPGGLGWNWNLTQMEFQEAKWGQDIRVKQDQSQNMYVGACYYVIRREYT